MAPSAPPSLEDVRRISADLGLDLSPEQLELARTMFAPIAAASEDPSVVAAPAPPTGRRVGESPGDDADPCNAIRLRCHVPPTGEGRLSGRRIGVKDTVSIAGIPLSGGSKLLDGFVPSGDATVVSRMLAEGGEIVAVLNMDDMAVAATGDTCAWGPVRNPHDREHLAGGSSGGSAAALFLDDIDLTLGGDQGGSIRIPSSWCGTVGHKPTFGLVPYTGVLGADATIDHVGPMARSVSDVALLLDVIAGPDPEDPRQRDARGVEAVAALDRGVKGLRIGVLKQGFHHPAFDAGVAERVHAALERLADHGAELVDVSVPAHNEAARWHVPVLCEGFSSLVESGGVIRHFGARQDPELARFLHAHLIERASQLSSSARSLLLVGRLLRERTRGQLYAAAQNARPALRAAYDRVLEDVDVLAMPTTPTTAARFDPERDDVARLGINMNATVNTATFDLTGHPSLSVPCGELQGLPVGLMLTGRHFDDATVLRVGRGVETTAG